MSVRRRKAVKSSSIKGKSECGPEEKSDDDNAHSADILGDMMGAKTAQHDQKE